MLPSLLIFVLCAKMGFFVIATVLHVLYVLRITVPYSTNCTYTGMIPVYI